MDHEAVRHPSPIVLGRGQLVNCLAASLIKVSTIFLGTQYSKKVPKIVPSSSIY